MNELYSKTGGPGPLFGGLSLNTVPTEGKGGKNETRPGEDHQQRQQIIRDLRLYQTLTEQTAEYRSKNGNGAQNG